jgi:glycosyltransferase involved in cell wall biosynthesis
VHYRLAIINDGSTDGTLEVAMELEKNNPRRVKVFNHSHNRGYSATLKTGFQAGLESGHPWIGFCDSDLQFDIRDVIKLVETAQSEGVDIVIGIRKNRADGILRRITGRSWHWINWLILGVRVKDVDCGFKLFKREVIFDLLPDLKGDHATISPELMARARRKDFSFAEVDVQHLPREHGEQTGVKLRVILGSFNSLFRVRKDIRREAQAQFDACPDLIEVPESA